MATDKNVSITMNGSSKLTLKQRKWIKKYIETGNATEAAMQVYKCKNKVVAGSIGSENLQKLAMPELMEEMGLTDVALLNVGIDGMTNSNKIHGTGDSFVEIPDHAVRHKYWDTMLRLKGKLSKDALLAVQVNVKPILGGRAEEANVQSYDGNKEVIETQ